MRFGFGVGECTAHNAHYNIIKRKLYKGLLYFVSIDTLIMYKGIRTMNQLSSDDDGNGDDDVTILYRSPVLD